MGFGAAAHRDVVLMRPLHMTSGHRQHDRRTRCVLTLAVSVAAIASASACTTDAPAPDNEPITNSAARTPGSPILGAVEGGRCDPHVVTVDRRFGDAQFTVTGQTGDRFSYTLTSRDGAVAHIDGSPFSEIQTSLTFSTGMSAADIDFIVISATGPVGVPGECTLTF